MPVLLLALLSCRTPPPADTAPAPADTGEAGSDPTEPTPGPPLPDCTPSEGDGGSLVALSGVLLAPDGPVAGTLVYDRDAGTITCAGDCDTAGARVVCTEGVISPGLVDAHNHLQYDTLPPWRHQALYDDRYQWQSDGDYWDYRTAYDHISDSYTCEIVKWAELRDLVSGATSAVGGAGGSCIDVLVRDLDEPYDAHGLDGYDLVYSSSNITSRYDAGDAASLQQQIADGSLSAFLPHVAEGVGGSVSAEIDYAFDIGLAGPGFGWVHATDATTPQLARMAETGTALVWSPRSNLDLYGATTPAAVARRLGVTVALGPDWTPSGSMNPVRELACADQVLRATGNPLRDRVLWEMATSDAARALYLDGAIGSLVAGSRADIAVYDWSDTPYRAVIDASPDQVRLVIVQGEALYGQPELAEPLARHPEWCEDFTPCASRKLICVKAAASGDDAATMADIESTLLAAMAGVQMPSQDLDYAARLFPLVQCSDERAACDPTSPSDGDADGDGVADASDDCPDAWDPGQEDADADGQGDTCDPCPLMPGSSGCRHDPRDIDDDGVPAEADDCPEAWDPDQADRDGDAIGDACDPCPGSPNPEGQGCPVTADILQDESSPDHPPEGTAVSLSGLVVTGTREGLGYFAQDPDLDRLGGLWVYDRGEAAVGRGDQVSVSGTYQEYDGLCEIKDATTTVTGHPGDPEPVQVADPCSVATGGADAEDLESMLVRVAASLAVTDSNPDAPDDYGTFVVNDCLWVDDMLSTEWDSNPAEGTTWDAITGVMTWAYDQRRLLPRGSEDFEP